VQVEVDVEQGLTKDQTHHIGEGFLRIKMNQSSVTINALKEDTS